MDNRRHLKVRQSIYINVHLAKVAHRTGDNKINNYRWFSRYVIAAMLVDGKQKIAH